MEQLTGWSQILMDSFKTFIEGFVQAIPTFIGAVLVFFIGKWIAKLISKAFVKILGVLKFNELTDKVSMQEFLNKANISQTPSGLFGNIVYYILLLFVIMTSADILGWNALTDELSNLIAYMPRILMAIAFFIVGIYIITFIRDFVMGASSSLGISSGKVISSIVFYILLIIISLTSLSQAGIDTSIISSNLLLILGSILAAAAISYGFASREVLSNIIAGYFSRSVYHNGMNIRVDDVEGEIVGSTSVGVTIKDKSGILTVVPTKTLITEKVQILGGSKNQA